MAEHWFDYRGVQLYRDAATKAYGFGLNALAVDADGAPNAYHKANTGLDDLANACYPKGSWTDILVPDPQDPSRAYEQPDGPFAGCFISRTTLANPALAETAPGKYADASVIPYLVLPGSFYALAGTGAMGDFAMARNLTTGAVSGAVIADVGPSAADLGEVSIALAARLGGVNPNPRTGKGLPKGPFQFVVFPGTRGVLRWPLDAARIHQTAVGLLVKAKGWDMFEPTLA